MSKQKSNLKAQAKSYQDAMPIRSQFFGIYFKIGAHFY